MNVNLHGIPWHKLPVISRHPVAVILAAISVMSALALWQAYHYYPDQELSADRIAGKRTSVNQEQLRTLTESLRDYHAPKTPNAQVSATFSPADVDTAR